MEMLVIGLVALAAFTAVLIPLFRRRPGIGDEKEFENIPSAASGEGESRDAATAADTARPGADGVAPAGMDPGIATARGAAEEHVEAEVLRYREAVRAGTVCRKCGQANPAGSAYCYECGSRLPLTDAQEFE